VGKYIHAVVHIMRRVAFPSYRGQKVQGGVIECRKNSGSWQENHSGKAKPQTGLCRSCCRLVVFSKYVHEVNLCFKTKGVKLSQTLCKFCYLKATTSLNAVLKKSSRHCDHIYVIYHFQNCRQVKLNSPGK
jgi:hypothetical protein